MLTDGHTDATENLHASLIRLHSACVDPGLGSRRIEPILCAEQGAGAAASVSPPEDILVEQLKIQRSRKSRRSRMSGVKSTKTGPVGVDTPPNLVKLRPLFGRYHYLVGTTDLRRLPIVVLVGLGTFALLLTSVRDACAVEPESLHYSAEPDCPSREQFVESLARLPGGREPLELRLQIDQTGPAAFKARMKLGVEPSRVLRGESCRELIDAVLVIVRIWATHAKELPSPQLEQLPVPERAESDASQLANAEALSANLASNAESEAQQPHRPSATTARQHSHTDAPESTSRPWWHGSSPVVHLEAGTFEFLGIAPSVALGVLGRAGFAWSRRSRLQLQVGLLRATSSSVAVNSTVVWSRLTALQAGACARLGPASTPLPQLCAELSYGRFEAGAVAGPIITHTASISRRWLAMGPAIRSEFPLIHQELGLWFELAFPVPLLRERLVYETPTIQIHRTWIVTPSIQLGIRGSFGGSTSAIAGTAR